MLHGSVFPLGLFYLLVVLLLLFCVECKCALYAVTGDINDTFESTDIVSANGQTVYENANGWYLFHLDGHWIFGPDYSTFDGSVGVESSSACPPTTGYMTVSGGKYGYIDMQVTCGTAPPTVSPTSIPSPPTFSPTFSPTVTRPLNDLVLLIPGESLRCSVASNLIKDFEESARLVAQNAHDLGAALVIIYGNDDLADLAWTSTRQLALRNDVSTPVLLLSEVDGAEITSLLETDLVEVQLSKSSYCDSVYRYGIPLGDDQSPACCAAADAIMSYSLPTDDFVSCPQGIGGLNIECEAPAQQYGYQCRDDCGGGAYAANGVCEDGGRDADFSFCPRGSDCKV